MTTNRNLSGECVITELSQSFERGMHMDEQKLPPQLSKIPQDLEIPRDLGIEELMDKRFDCQYCHGDCIRRRICCDGKGQCKLCVIFDTQILFWCGSENKFVQREFFCETVFYAKPKKIVYGLRSNVTLFVGFDDKFFCFDDHGETLFNWPKKEDDEWSE